MKLDKEIKKVGQDETSAKMVWQLPELVDLDINEATQNQGAGPSVNDGGNAFVDYNS
jgi:hypothetical protein